MSKYENTLKPGGWLLVEGYNEAQLGRGTGGPPVADLMLNLEELLEEFFGLYSATCT